MAVHFPLKCILCLKYPAKHCDNKDCLEIMHHVYNMSFKSFLFSKALFLNENDLASSRLQHTSNHKSHGKRFAKIIDTCTCNINKPILLPSTDFILFE